MSRDLIWQLGAIAGYLDPASIQKIATGNATAALKKHTPYRIIADADSNIKLGTGAVSAASTDFFLPAKVYLVIYTGPYDKIAVTGGNLYVIEQVPDTLPATSDTTGFGG